ncbi:urea active transporter [Bulinus truncatus]|nr:urea active transporter [Bulinus truncatus]
MTSTRNVSDFCKRILNSTFVLAGEKGIKAPIESFEICLILLATGILGFLISRGFTLIRKHVYRDDDQVDTSFDAGGNVNAGLISTTIVSQWTWAATLLQSSAVAARYGISGSFWYASGATIQILLFSMLSVQLKTRAPGAKTFLQVIRARFGKTTHIVFCFFALATNVIVTAMLMLGGSAVITALVKFISVEYATTLIAAIIGGYTLIGGLGATFYVCYFNTAIIYILLVTLMFKVYEDSDDPKNPLGDIPSVFNYVTCATGPAGNRHSSYLTILSNGGLMFGLINIVGNFGTVFMDQSYWQISVAAKPKQGVIGFLLGGLAWFAIPFSLSMAMGLAYVALSTCQGEAMLSDDDISLGLVPPVVAYQLLGKTGAIMVAVMVIMAVTSTGSSEVMAVTSIVVYDIYALYLKPYRLMTDTNSCILCGKGRGRMANPRDKCVCVSMAFCAKCHQDTKSRTESRRAIKPDYKCLVHGSFRVYNDFLSRIRNWTTVWITMAIIPLTICLYMIKASLGWVYLFMGVLVGSAVIPTALAMFWERLTGVAMMAGSIGGALMAISVWLGVASTYEGGLNNWWANTGNEMSMLCGNLVAILGGGLITVIVSFVSNWHYDVSMSEEIWENTRDIDNPLSPWMEKYQKDLQISGSHRLDNRPSLQDVQKAFRRAKVMAYFLSTTFTVVLVIAWPAFMTTIDVMTLTQFTGWVRVSEIWVWLAMLAMIVLPLVNESWDIWSTFVERKKIKALPQQDDDVPVSDHISQSKRSIHSKRPASRLVGANGNQPSIEETDPAETDSMYIIAPVVMDTGQATFPGDGEVVNTSRMVENNTSARSQNTSTSIGHFNHKAALFTDHQGLAGTSASLAHRTAKESGGEFKNMNHHPPPPPQNVDNKRNKNRSVNQEAAAQSEWEEPEIGHNKQVRDELFDREDFNSIAEEEETGSYPGHKNVPPTPDMIDFEEPLF